MKDRHRGAYVETRPGLFTMMANHARLYSHNVSITIAPSEERVKNHDAMSGAYATARDRE